MPISPLWSVTFLSTPSARRATGDPRPDGYGKFISIHALREEGDYTLMSGLAQLTYFYPRPPRGGRPEPQLLYCNYCTISIHALREEGDYSPTTPTTKPRNFYPRPPRGGRPPRCRWFSWVRGISIHALREEGDNKPKTDATRVLPFLSTPSARRATSLVNSNLDLFLFLSTPSARRATPQDRRDQGRRLISIHALREEGDLDTK